MENHSNNHLQPFSKWLRNSGVAAVTGWRWRKKKYIKTLNIAGRLYVTQEAVVEFHRRAAAGEFSKNSTRPEKEGV
jgi:hypothetical protein